MWLLWKTKKQKEQEEQERIENERLKRKKERNKKIRNFFAYGSIAIGLMFVLTDFYTAIFYILLGITLLPKLYEYLFKIEKLNNKKLPIILPVVTVILVSMFAEPLSDVDVTDVADIDNSSIVSIVEESDKIQNLNVITGNEIENTIVNETVDNTVSNSVVNSVTNEVVVENIVDEKQEKDDLVKQKNNSLMNIPQYSNKPYIEINDNKPFFVNSDLVTTSYESYSDLDSLGRCGVAIASIGKDIMPTEERGNIGSVKPSGWHTVKYQGIDGNYLYNRCHLIGYQLTGENANVKNLITGTRYMNNEGMLPFENMVDDYIEEYNNHVLYRVTPLFEGNNLLASGVLIEAKSVEDNGAGIEFCVYCYNVQPGITINYATGESTGPEFTGSQSNSSTSTTVVPPATSSTTTSSSSSTSSTSQSTTTKKTDSTTTTKPATTTTTAPVNNSTMVWIPKSGKKYHSNPSCSNMKNPSQVTQSEAVSMGKTPCSKCY